MLLRRWRTAHETLELAWDREEPGAVEKARRATLELLDIAFYLQLGDLQALHRLQDSLYWASYDPDRPDPFLRHIDTVLNRAHSLISAALGVTPDDWRAAVPTGPPPDSLLRSLWRRREYKKGAAMQPQNPQVQQLQGLIAQFKDVKRHVAYATLLTAEMAKLATTMGNKDIAADYTKAQQLLQQALTLISSENQHGAALGE
jgi:hypothetical protein